MKYLFTVLIIICLATTVASETRVFELRHHQGTEFEDVVRQMIEPGEKVVSFRNNLIVTGERASLSAVADLLQRLDRPVAQYRITIDQSRSSRSESSDRSVSGRIDNGSVIFRTQGRTPGSTAQSDVLVHDGRDRLRLGASEGSRQVQQNVSQYIVVTEGAFARLSVGQEVPFTETWVDLCRRHGHQVTQTTYRSVATGFEARPVTLGDTVQLDVYPFMAFLDNAHRDLIRFQELQTSIRVMPGEWVDLGAHMGGQDAVSREILGYHRENESLGSEFRVRIDLQE